MPRDLNIRDTVIYIARRAEAKFPAMRAVKRCKGFSFLIAPRDRVFTTNTDIATIPVLVAVAGITRAAS
jgi:hypothetical protein